MRGRPFRFADLGGGVDLRLGFEDAAGENKQRWALARNVTSDRGPTVRTRGGSSALFDFDSITTAATGVYAVDSTTEPTIILSTVGDLFAFTVDGGDLATTTFTGGAYEWTSAPPLAGQGPVYGMNGSDAYYFTGSAFGVWTASAGTLPIGKYVTQWSGRTWVTGVAAKPASLYGSDINDPRNWDTTVNALEVQLDPWDGQANTGFGSVGDYLILFKHAKTFVINDVTTGTNRQLAANIGCVAHRTIAGSSYGLFFLSEHGVYQTDGNSIKPISSPVDAIFEALTADEQAAAFACFYNDRYYITVPDHLGIMSLSLTSQITLEYDPQAQTWWLHGLRQSTQWAVWRRFVAPEMVGTLDVDRTSFHYRGVQKVFDITLGTDFDPVFNDPVTQDPLPISGSVISTWHTLGDPTIVKRCRAVHINGDGTLTAKVSKDWATTTTNLTLENLPTAMSATSKGLRALSPGVARAWRLEVDLSGVAELDSYTMFMDGRKN